MNDVNDFIKSLPSYYQNKAAEALQVMIAEGYEDSLFTREIVKRLATSKKLNFNKEALYEAIEKAKHRNMRSSAFVLNIYSMIHPEGVWSRNMQK